MTDHASTHGADILQHGENAMTWHGRGSPVSSEVDLRAVLGRFIPAAGGFAAPFHFAAVIP